MRFHVSLGRAGLGTSIKVKALNFKMQREEFRVMLPNYYKLLVKPDGIKPSEAVLGGSGGLSK